MATQRRSYTQRYREKVSNKKPQQPNGLFGMGETSGLARSGGGISNGNKPLVQHQSEQQQRKASLSNRRTSNTGSDSPKQSSNLSSQSGKYVAGLNSLIRMASEKRARRVRFYRNGDRFFGGMVYAVSTERFRTFESLLTSLTSSSLCNSRAMPNGVRHIFSADGARRIESLSELEEGESYVCASTEVFRSLDYCRNEEPGWNQRLFPQHAPVNGFHKLRQTSEQPPRKHVQIQPSNASPSVSSAPDTQTRRPISAMEDKPPKSARAVKASKSEVDPEHRQEYDEYQRSHVIPRLITVIRHGRRPRKAVRLLLNKKTAKSLEQVMADVSDAVRLDCGSVKKLYTQSGRRVTCLADFFQEETVFLACGSEKVSQKDLELDRSEVRQVSAYRPFGGKRKERVTLRTSQMSAGSKSPVDRITTPSSAASDRNSQNAASVKVHHEENKENTKKEDKPPMPLAVTNKYEVGPVIGTGNFAVVMECKDKKTSKKYALKIINRDSCKGKQENMLNNEVTILRSLKHPNIIRLVEDFISPHQIFYIMELVKGGDLFDAISNSDTSYTEQDASGMMYNLASALEYLHSLNIVHRDVKPENILIRQHEDDTKSLKLGDFGLAIEVKGPQYTVCGTPTYVAPEVIAETGYGLKIDIWSAGVIGYILLCGFPPFSSPNDNQDELFDLIMTGNFDFPSPFWDDITSEAKNLISGMVEIDADARMTATQVLDHKWVASDTHYEQDLKTRVSKGLGTCFRRGRKGSPRHAGIKIIATTALDKASRFFQGRGASLEKGRIKKP